MHSRAFSLLLLTLLALVVVACSSDEPRQDTSSEAVQETPRPEHSPPHSPEWQRTLQKARGQTVYFKAWAGSEAANGYIRWAADQVAERYGVELVHVKITNPAELVSGTLAEKTAGKHENGATDLLWINGENFLAMKENGLLYGPFVERLPNYRAYVDAEHPFVTHDFTVPTEGFEAPWGMAQVVFIHDAARLPSPPTSATELLAFAKANPGRFTHPQVRYFMGATFLKQVLLELTPDPAVLEEAPTEATYGPATAPLWQWYDELRPHLWRSGSRFPESAPAQHQLLADGEVDISMDFSPFAASYHISTGLFPPTVRTWVPQGGTIGNANFLAIPYNSGAVEGALVVINFLLSPQAQLHKMDPQVWGSYTVLDMDRLPPASRAAFAAMELGPATLTPEELGTPLPEPHPGWMTRVKDEWHRRYAQ